MIYFAIAFGIIVFIFAPEFFIALCLLAGLVFLAINFFIPFLIFIIFVLPVLLWIYKYHKKLVKYTKTIMQIAIFISFIWFLEYNEMLNTVSILIIVAILGYLARSSNITMDISSNQQTLSKLNHIKVFDKTKHKGLYYSAIKNIKQSVYRDIKTSVSRYTAIQKHTKKPDLLSPITFLAVFITCMIVFCVLFFGLFGLLGYTKLTLFSLILFVLFSAFIAFISYQITKKYYF